MRFRRCIPFLAFVCILYSMKWALLSVWDKSGIVELAQALVKNKYSILSSEGLAGRLPKLVSRSPKYRVTRDFPK